MHHTQVTIETPTNSYPSPHLVFKQRIISLLELMSSINDFFQQMTSVLAQLSLTRLRAFSLTLPIF